MVEPKISVDLEAEDHLGLLVRKVTVESQTKGDLKKQAHAVVERITYLSGGELKVIEVDAPANAAQIRSRKPHDGYVEVILRDGNSLTLERRPTALFISKVDFERLIADLKQIL